MDDGFISAAESRRLEGQADALLKGDAKANGFIKDNGRGFSAYARSIGITTKKILETTYKHEVAVTLLFPEIMDEEISMDRALEIKRRESMDNTGHIKYDREEAP